MIRGLNDNASGGLGGFATICMVTSLVQNMPTHKDHLGELLVEFFNLYGNLLNVQDVGIRMEPPGYFSKVGNRSRDLRSHQGTSLTNVNRDHTSSCATKDSIDWSSLTRTSPTTILQVGARSTCEYRAFSQRHTK